LERRPPFSAGNLEVAGFAALFVLVDLGVTLCATEKPGLLDFLDTRTGFHGSFSLSF
jgi:hypothetical protein